MADSPKDEINVIREDLGKLRQDVTELTRALKDLVADRASSAQEQFKTGVSDAREHLKQKASQAGDQGREYYDAFEKQLSERPLTTLVVSFGIGFILSKMLDSGGRR